MASNLTITSGAPGNVTSRAFGAGQTESASGSALGVFAALLGGTAAPVEMAGIDAAKLVRLGAEAGTGDKDADAEALAAALDLAATIVPTAPPANPQPMVDFVEALTALKKSLDSGEPLDPDLIGKAEQALEGLAEALGLSIDDLPVPEDFAALLAQTGADETGLAGTLTQMLAPLAQSLAGAKPSVDASAIQTEDAAQAQLKSLGDKLAALLAALEDGAVADEKLTAIGMPADGEATAEIEEALARFTATMKAEAPVVPDEPVLATPTLKTADTAIAGKPAVEGVAAPADRQPTEDRGANDNRRDGDERPQDIQRRDPRPQQNAAPAAPPAETGQPAAPANTASQDSGAMRIEAAIGPRVIQSGYQTSQQQLNLPQIAFELARQVDGGNTRFQIRLDPPELGRIDVRLDIDQAGQVNARLTVEKAETLDLMQRDQRALERALQQAGLDTGKTNLEFSLKQNPFAGQSGQGDRQGTGGDGRLVAGDNTGAEGDETPPPTVNLYRGSLQASGINIIA